MAALKVVFWSSLAALAWTHVGYPGVVTALAWVRRRPVAKADQTPSVSVVVAAHDEEAVIERRIANLLELDYPADRIEIVVASDASTDGTDELVEVASRREQCVRLVRCPRGGKVAAQNLAVRETTREIVAFSDANAVWDRQAIRKLARNFADPEVAYVCGRVELAPPAGVNREGAYWRYELFLRERESALGSVTGGNGSIYAVRRKDYTEVDPRFGHDLAFPYLMVQRGRRAVYEPEAVAYEKPSRTSEEEYRRKVRMFEHCWLILLRGRMLRGLDRLYLLEMISHRVLRYASGLFHLALLGSSAALARRGSPYRLGLGAQAALVGLAAAGRAGARVPGAALAHYYVLVTSATVVALPRTLVIGVPAVWDKAEGTR
jgi:cellulose synthase/poly-beta-1,6-N-acetylglucosamine synthase-like glycosyltransferase